MNTSSDETEKTPLSPSKGHDDSEIVTAEPPSKFEESENEKLMIENGIPADKLNVVLFVMMLHGLGTLIAWNIFITIAPGYFQRYKLESAFHNVTNPDEKPIYPGYVQNFMNYVCICSQLPNLTVNAIGLFVDKGNLFIRITVSLIVIICSCIFTIIFIFVDTSDWPFGFFMLTMITVIVLNSANGVYQNSIFGIVGSFPSKYINAVVLGNNICGLLVTLLLIATIKIFTGDEKTNAAVYFSIALCALIFCLASVFYLRKNHFYVHQIAIERQSSKDRAVYSLKDYCKTFQEYWLPLSNVWSVFFVTLFLFPSVLLNIHLYPEKRHNERDFDFFVDYNLYGILFVFLNFNFFSCIGSKLADFFTWPSPKYVAIPITLRWAFIPIFYLTNYNPGNKRIWGVYIENEYIVFVLIALMSISHGYYSSISMMYAPSGAEASKARIIGKMSAFFLVLGIFCGIGFSFLAEYPVQW
uniref:Equilibrative nucleoside transporter 1 n=1 Tax=Panagrolaimus sp. PS1159 TaxID=55785 RepID=A0AC35FW58_9BILA